MIEIAQQVTVVADASKLGRRSLSLIGPLKKVHRLITGEGAPLAIVEELQAVGIEVVLV